MLLAKMLAFSITFQSGFTSSKSTIETLEQGVKYVRENVKCKILSIKTPELYIALHYIQKNSCTRYFDRVKRWCLAGLQSFLNYVYWNIFKKFSSFSYCNSGILNLLNNRNTVVFGRFKRMFSSTQKQPSCSIKTDCH